MHKNCGANEKRPRVKKPYPRWYAPVARPFAFRRWRYCILPQGACQEQLIPRPSAMLCRLFRPSSPRRSRPFHRRRRRRPLSSARRRGQPGRLVPCGGPEAGLLFAVAGCRGRLFAFPQRAPQPADHLAHPVPGGAGFFADIGAAVFRLLPGVAAQLSRPVPCGGPEAGTFCGGRFGGALVVLPDPVPERRRFFADPAAAVFDVLPGAFAHAERVIPGEGSAARAAQQFAHQTLEIFLGQHVPQRGEQSCRSLPCESAAQESGKAFPGERSCAFQPVPPVGRIVGEDERSRVDRRIDADGAREMAAEVREKALVFYVSRHGRGVRALCQAGRTGARSKRQQDNGEIQKARDGAAGSSHGDHSFYQENRILNRCFNCKIGIKF